MCLERWFLELNTEQFSKVIHFSLPLPLNSLLMNFKDCDGLLILVSSKVKVSQNLEIITENSLFREEFKFQIP